VSLYSTCIHNLATRCIVWNAHNTVFGSKHSFEPNIYLFIMNIVQKYTRIITANLYYTVVVIFYYEAFSKLEVLMHVMG